MKRRATKWVAAGAALGAIVGALVFADQADAGMPVGADAVAVLRSQDASYVDRTLWALRQAGVTWIRSYSYWERVQPAPKTWDWSVDDRIARDLAAHHLEWRPIVGFSPAWAASGGSVQRNFYFGGAWHLSWDAPTESHFKDYARFAVALAKRYHLHTVEVWNEPDVPQTWSGRFCCASAGQYLRMYTTVRNAFRAAHMNTTVMVGGIVTWQYLPYMLKLAPKGFKMDALGVHAYNAAPGGVEQVIRHYEQILDHFGYKNVPVANTEYGWCAMPESDSRASWWLNGRPARLYQSLVDQAKDPRVLSASVFNFGPPAPCSMLPADLTGIDRATHAIAQLPKPKPPRPAPRKAHAPQRYSARTFHGVVRFVNKSK